MLSGKSFLITGGTGSFGHTLVNRLLHSEVARIIIFSRDEAKQYFMQQSIPDKRLEFVLGDIRNSDSVKRAIYGVDFIFHAAALKQVPASENYPMEFVQTNIQGSHNLLQALDRSTVSKAVFLSTDKAVYPVNAMGMTKAMMEKLVRSANYRFETTASITRYGNVIGSRGSVIPQFIETIKRTGRVTVTNPQMTRFMMSLEDSVELVLFALENGNNGDLFVQKSPSASVKTIVDALGILLKCKVVIDNVGVRQGEKIHETLLTAEERNIAIDSEKYFQVRKISGNEDVRHITDRIEPDYTSTNTQLLTSKELAELLSSIPYIRKMLDS
jgi:UDP-glucose 4-epimerase